MQSVHQLKLSARFWLARRLPACREITSMISQSMDRKLNLRERIQLRLHLLICDACERYMKQLFFLRDAMHRHPAHAPHHEELSHPGLSPEARARLKQALSEKKTN